MHQSVNDFSKQINYICTAIEKSETYNLISIITMKHTRVKDLLNSTNTLHEINAKGWVRTFRNNQFIALNDGSTINNIQCVVDFENTPDETLKRITTGAAIIVAKNPIPIVPSVIVLTSNALSTAEIIFTAL